MKPDISIIIPVYNSEKYLNVAIKSILNQTYENYELILIDDGSTDNSGKICDEYAKKDNRIRVVHKENGGICDARNIGLQIANGRYITFMDNDDEVNDKFLEENYRLIKEKGVDIVKFGREAIYLNNGNIDKRDVRSFEKKLLLQEELKKEKLDLWYKNFFICVWDAIYDREVIRDIEFDTNLKKGGEDIAFNLEVFSNIKSVYLNDKIYYKHYIREGVSTSTKFNHNFIEDIERKYKSFESVFRTNEIQNTELYNCIIVRDFLNALMNNFTKKECTISKKERKDILNEYRLKLEEKNNILKMLKISNKYTVFYVLYKHRCFEIIEKIFKCRNKIKDIFV